MMSLPVWLPGPMFLRGVSVPGPMSLEEGVCPGSLKGNPGIRKAGGTHSTGMLSCQLLFSVYKLATICKLDQMNCLPNNYYVFDLIVGK